MSGTPIIYTGAMFKHLRTQYPEIKLYALINKSKVARQTITEFESGSLDIRISTLTKLLNALYELKADKKGAEK